MGNGTNTTSAGGWTFGPSVRRVLVEAVDLDTQFVHVLMPAINNRMKIPLGVRRVRSEIPKVGETWLIERNLGSQWTMAAVVKPGIAPPVVTGDRSMADEVSLTLLSALVALGLVVDGTHDSMPT